MLKTLRNAAARRRAAGRTKAINLALQGGGAHGAFTWGVLDRLLEDGRTRFDGVSGTSAGAMNAAVLAAGLMAGGADEARARLETFWRRVSDLARFNPLGSVSPDLMTAGGPFKEWAVDHVLFDLFSRLVSPYQFNPLDYNPLRDVLETVVDFAPLRRESPVDLYISATDVGSGSVKVFRTPEMSADVVLASACLPHLHRAIKIGRRHYWDGGYSANPAILPLVRHGSAADTLIVQINPFWEKTLPTDARDILARLNTITFNAPLKREVELIEQCRALAREGLTLGGRLRRRLIRHRFHLIETRDVTRKLGHASKLSPDWEMLRHLRNKGRAAATGWLRRHFDDVGRTSTVDLATKYL